MYVVDLSETTPQNLHTQSLGQIFARNKMNINNNQSKTQQHEIYSRGSVTPKRCPTSPFEVPTKGQVFSNPNPAFTVHKGQDEITYSKLLKEQMIQTS